MALYILTAYESKEHGSSLSTVEDTFPTLEEAQRYPGARGIAGTWRRTSNAEWTFTDAEGKPLFTLTEYASA